MFRKLDAIFRAFVALIFGALAFLLFYGSCIGAFGILCWQSYQYLELGTWIPQDGLQLLWHVFGPHDWLYAPEHWVGVHKLLAAVHAGAALIAICWPLAFVALALRTAAEPT